MAGAKADLHRQAAEGAAAYKQRVAIVTDLRERGNLAMQKADPQAARQFYSQALDVPQVGDDERAKTLGNRSACLRLPSRWVRS